ncbi:alpha/beta fold hydrolase [Pseudonocardia sichuanensis]
MTDEWRLPETYRSSAGTVRWHRLGPPGAPPVVLLHGTPFSSYVWRGVARALARRHRVHVWDMPGYGASEKREGQDVSLAVERDVFVELLGEWGLAEPVVIAHDSGGAVALGAHLLRGARYRKLALVDAVSLPPWGSAFSQLVGEHADVFARLPPGAHAALLREYVGSASSPGLHQATLDALVAPWVTDGGQQAFYHQLAARRHDQRYTDAMQERYATIGVPVLVCWGEDDSWVPVERGRELADRIPGAQLRIIPGAGHLVQEDRPAELTAALVEFLHDVG